MPRGLPDGDHPAGAELRSTWPSWQTARASELGLAEHDGRPQHRFPGCVFLRAVGALGSVRARFTGMGPCANDQAAIDDHHPERPRAHPASVSLPEKHLGSKRTTIAPALSPESAKYGVPGRWLLATRPCAQ